MKVNSVRIAFKCVQYHYQNLRNKTDIAAEKALRRFKSTLKEENVSQI